MRVTSINLGMGLSIIPGVAISIALSINFK